MSWICKNCEAINQDSSITCEVCGKDNSSMDFRESIEKEALETKPVNPLPKCLQRFNVGAFALTLFWGITNRVWWALLVFIPFVNIVVAIWLGIRGNKYAWENRKDELTIEEFDKFQHRWNIAGWIVIGLNILAIIAGE